MKNTLLAVYEILHENSDVNHPITREKIEALLLQRFDISITRQTLKSYFDMLNDSGIEVSGYEQKKGYYLMSRDFEKSEINLLCNAVYAAHFIPENDSRNLIKKLLKTQSKYDAEIFKNQIYVQNMRKTKNKAFFFNVDILIEAISNKKVVSFNYLKYDLNKNLVLRRDKKYLIHPYYIISNNENFYLICINDSQTQFSHYRIDKMKDIKIEEITLRKIENQFDPYEYAREQIYMYGGEVKEVIFKCCNTILDDIIDKFGKDVKIQKQDNDHFFAIFNASKTGIQYWALQYLNYCELIQPVEWRNEIRELLQSKISDTYK